MKNRQLIRTNTVSCSIASLIPETIVESTGQTVLPSTFSGGIDSCQSLAYLVTPASPETEHKGDRLTIWKHVVYTLSEQILSALSPRGLVEFEHPEKSSATNDGNSNTAIKLEHLIALVPISAAVSSATSTSGPHANTPMSPARSTSDTSASVSTLDPGTSLYWSSPNGLLCYWNDISSSYRSSSLSETNIRNNFNCDAFVRLPLEGHELVTVITFSTIHSAILIGTSLNRTFICTKNNRPMELRARLLFSHDDDDDSIDDDGQSGLISGLYSRVFTPGKKHTRRPKPRRLQQEHGKGSILQIFPIPPPRQILSPKPKKSVKISHPNSVDEVNLVTITETGMLDSWSTRYRSDTNVHVGQYTGTLSLLSVVEKELKTETNDVALPVITPIIKVLDAVVDTSCASPSVVACLKVVFGQDNKDGRIYLVHCPIDPSSGVVKPGQISWLSRYSSDVIMPSEEQQLGSGLECAGLVTNTMENYNKNDETKQISTTVYCVLKPSQNHLRQLPVTISTARFWRGNDLDKVQNHDIDLPSNTTPSVVRGTVANDFITDGCLVMGSNGCVVNLQVTFPNVTTMNYQTALSMQRQGRTKEEKELVEVLTSHLLSTFRIDLGRQQQSHNQQSFGHLDSSLPQSIHASDCGTLSYAVSKASAQLANERYDQMNFASTSRHNIAASALNTIQRKLEIHKKFVNFLTHAGIYRKVNLQGRLKLRDHGEMINAIGHLLQVWESSRLEMDEEERTDCARTISTINDRLIGIEEAVTEFTAKFLGLEQEILQEENSVWEVFNCCNLTYRAIDGALRFREEESTKLYDLQPDAGRWGWGDYSSKSGAVLGGCSPWTSSRDVLNLLEQNLISLRTAMENKLKQRIIETRIDEFLEITRHLSIYILDGYRDITPSRRDEIQYDAVKSLGISLVQAICPVDDDLAFSLSLEHGHFDGILQSQHDLGPMLSDTSTDETSDYAALYIRPHSRTGLSFQKYVFCWFVDRDMSGRVLELGSNCPEILSEYMEEDKRLSHLRWIQNARTERFKESTDDLMKLVSGGMTALGKKNNKGISLQDRELVLSLAKLSSIIDGNSGPQDLEKVKAIDDNMELCTAQKILAGMIDEPDKLMEKAKSSEDLFPVALAQVETAQLKEEKVRACLVGLSVARTLKEKSPMSKNSTSSTSAAGLIWAKAIDADVSTWFDLSQHWNEMSDMEKGSIVQDTIFSQLFEEYYGSVSEGSIGDNVGFKDPIVKQVCREAIVGSDLKQIDHILQSILHLSLY